MNLEQKIEEIKNIKGSCGKFPIPRFTTESMIEEFHKYYHYIKECISKTNDTLDIVKWLVNQGLSEEVANRLIIMIEEGVISDSIFKNPLFIKSINDKITEFKNDGTFNDLIEQQLNSIYQLIDEKMNEITGTVNSIIDEVDMRILELQNFETQLEQIENKNIEQDNRLKEVEYKNKVQDVYISGLFNENNDKRLSIEGEGNSLKLEGSKKGLVEVESIVGDTLVNIKSHGEKVTTQPFIKYITLNIQQNEDYTLKIINNLGYAYAVFNADGTESITGYSKNNVITFNSSTNSTIRIYCRILNVDGSLSDEGTIEDGWDELILLEGDYTSKPIPSEYFECMQSTFEECKVTQEMIDSGEENVENLGKYKVEVKVRGKNLFDFDTYTMENVLNSNVTVDSIDKTITMQRTNTGKYEYVEFDVNLQANTPYVLSYNIDTLVNNSKPLRRFEFVYSDGTTKTVLHRTTSFEKINEQKRIKKIRVCMEVIGSDKVILSKIQIEGDTQTSYEPYYERTQTVYLNSPLLKGDEIVCKEDVLYHYHKMKQFVLDDSRNWNLDSNELTNTVRFNILSCLTDSVPTSTSKVIATYSTSNKTTYNIDGENIEITTTGVLYLRINKTKATDLISLKLWLQSNPIPFVYELAEPYYEKISDDKLLLEIPNSATLSVESVIPCQSISATYTSVIPSVYSMEYDIDTLQDTNVDIIATSWDTDFRVCEIEWTLEELTGTQQINLLSERGINTMALSRFEQAKIIILGDAYYRPTFEKQLATYLKRDYLTQEEYDILIAMMDARETIEGE